MPGSWTIRVLGIVAMAGLAGAALLAIVRGSPVWAGSLVVGELVLAFAVVLLQRRGAARAAGQREGAFRAAQEVQRGELQRARDTLRSVIESLPHGVAVISPGGIVELINARAASFGLQMGGGTDGQAHSWLKSLVSAAARRREPVNLASLDGAPPSGAQRHPIVQIFEEGRELFFMPQAMPLLDEKGQSAGVVLVMVDVTGSRQAQEAKSSLISSFSHELKTPMTSLQMSIYLLLDDAASRLTPRQLELLAAARDDADRLHRLMEEMLRTARNTW